MNDDNFLKVAKQVALEAGKIIQKYSGKFGEKSFKEDDVSNFATTADLEAEKTIITLIKKHFPSHNIISEELENQINQGSEFTWAIDPLDGTFAFSHSVPQFCVSVGLMKENIPISGVIYHLSSKELFWAQMGKGAYLNGKPVHISDTKSLNEAGVYFDFAHRIRRQTKHDLYIKPLLNNVGRVFSIGSTALGFAWVGKGVLDSSVAQAWIWDFVAGTVIVREAGGKVTDFQGREPDWSQERLNIVASNGLIHDQILEALKDS